MRRNIKQLILLTGFHVFFLSNGFSQSYLELPESLGVLPERDPSGGKIVTGTYLVPNERYPLDAQPALVRAGPGIIAGPGSERVLFDFLMAESSTHVLALDIDPDIIKFHKLNSILCRISPPGERETYRRIRTQPETDAWAALAAKALINGKISAADLAVINDPQNLFWWKEKVSLNPNWGDFYIVDTSPLKHYEGVNYLYDDAQFIRVQNLMLSGRFQAVQVDLGNAEQVGRVTAAIKKSGIPVSVLDLSNVWQDEFPNNYLSERQVTSLFERFNEVASPTTLIVTTAGQARRSNNDHKLIKYVVHDFAEARKKASGINDWSKRELGWEDFTASIKYHFRDPPTDENGKRCLILLSN